MTIAALVTLLAVSGFTGTAEEDVSGWTGTAAGKQLRNGCKRLYSIREFGRYAKPKYRSRLSITKPQKRVIAKRGRCQRSLKKQRRAGDLLDIWRSKRAYVWLWRVVFGRMPAGERAWAYSTSSCESGRVPWKHDGSGTYHGAFQFSLRTAWAAGFRADPHTRSWYEQAVRAIRWKWRTSDEQWPVCGD